MSQGNRILQPHKLIGELEDVVCDENGCYKLRDGPFGQVIKSTQVHSFLFYSFLYIYQSFNICLHDNSAPLILIKLRFSFGIRKLSFCLRL